MERSLKRHAVCGCLGLDFLPTPSPFCLTWFLSCQMFFPFKKQLKDRASLSELVAFWMATCCIRSPRWSCKLDLAALCTGSILMCNTRRNKIYILLYYLKQTKKKRTLKKSKRFKKKGEKKRKIRKKKREKKEEANKVPPSMGELHQCPFSCVAVG